MTNFLFNRRPFVYGLTYLGLIPLFALLYSFLPYHFYHSTAKFEYSILNPKADEILDGLKLEIQNNYRQKTLDIKAGSVIDIENISLGSLKYEEGRFYFKLCFAELFKVKQQDTNYAYSRGCFDLSFPYKAFMKTIEPQTSKINIYREIKFETETPKNDTLYLGTDLRIFFVVDSLLIPVIKVNSELDSKMKSFANTIYGFPNSFGDNYWRMFYFSSVTLTTLGYGDIVPVSNTARILISIEAILGVIIIGLFLNALSKRVR